MVEEGSASPIEKSKADKEEVEAIESILLSKFSQDNYNIMPKEINTAYNMDGNKETKVWSHHELKKEIPHMDEFKYTCTHDDKANNHDDIENYNVNSNKEK